MILLKQEDQGEGTKSSNIEKVKFVSPFARYLAVLPFAEKQRMEEIARIAEANRKKKLCPEKNVVFENDVLPVSIPHHRTNLKKLTFCH